MLRPTLTGTGIAAACRHEGSFLEPAAVGRLGRVRSATQTAHRSPWRVCFCTDQSVQSGCFLMSVLHAQAAGVRRRRRWLFRDLDVSVSPGDVVAIVGPPGSGRTTVL